MTKNERNALNAKKEAEYNKALTVKEMLNQIAEMVAEKGLEDYKVTGYGEVFTEKENGYGFVSESADIALTIKNLFESYIYIDEDEKIVGFGYYD